METALAIKPGFAPVAMDTLQVNIAHIDALASAISNIDSDKHSHPQQLPIYLAQGHQALLHIRNTKCFDTRVVKVATEQIDAFEHCLKCIQDAISTYQHDLLGPFIEAAHDLIELMLGDMVGEVYAKEDAA
jgi:hypothetical protein